MGQWVKPSPHRHFRFFAIWQVVGVATTAVTMATAGLYFGITSIVQNRVSCQPVDIFEQIKHLFLLKKGSSIQWNGY